LEWLVNIKYTVNYNPIDKINETNTSTAVYSTKNTELTDRSVNEISPTQIVELGNYNDASEVHETAVNNQVIQQPHSLTNMETFDLSSVMNREYPVKVVTWTSSQAAGTVIASNDMPADLFNQSFINDKLKDFRLFKAGIRYSVRVTASQFLYGKIMVTFDPMSNINGNQSIFSNIYSASGNPHVLVSASAAEAAIFDVPFVSNKRALDLNSYAIDEMGKFRIHVLNPLTHINAQVCSAQIIVTAQFLDAQLFLPIDKFATQSKSNGGNLEAKRKALNKSITSEYENLKASASNIETPSFVSQYTDFFKAVSTPLLIGATMLGLSKPATQDKTTVMKVNPYHDLTTGKGIDTNVVLAMDPDNKISTMPNVGGISEDEMDLKYVVGTPMLINSNGYLPNTPPTLVMSMGPFDYANCFVDHITQMFAYWSGSYKYKAYITASRMHNVRGVFYLTSTATNTNWENCYHKVVDITGDTEVEFTIPYTPSSVSTNRINSDYGVYFAILSWSQASDSVSNPIYINSYKAGASDFRFGGLREVVFTKQSNPRKDFSSVFEPIHPSITGYEPVDVIYGEEYTTVREIIHRYYPTILATVGPHTQPYYFAAGNAGTGWYTGLELIGLMYRFHRGSIRCKLIQKDTINRSARLVDVNNQFVGTTLSSSVNPVIEATIPYYSNLLFDSNTTTAITLGLALDGKSGGQYLFRSAGDDFSFHFLVSPPNGILQNPTTTQGLPAFQTWLST